MVANFDVGICPTKKNQMNLLNVYASSTKGQRRFITGIEGSTEPDVIAISTFNIGLFRFAYGEAERPHRSHPARSSSVWFFGRESRSNG